MTVKEWLNRGWKLNREIDALKEEQRRALELATATTSAPQEDRVQGGEGNRTADKFANYAAYAAEIDSRIDDLFQIKQEIDQAIEKVENTTYRTLLFERYINFKKWEQIAVDMDYSYVHIVRLHGKALQKVKDVIECYI